MSSTANSQREREDRELFSELIEPPVNPFLFHVQPPLVNGLDPNFYVQICLETLWKWRGLTAGAQKEQLFAAFNSAMRMLGYGVKEESQCRIVQVLKTRINWMLRQTEKISNSRRRRLKREEKWSTITVQEDEICQSPGDIVAQRRVREKELEKENELLRSQLNEKAAKLYEEMARARQPPSSLVNRGKNFHEVGERQQKRQLDKIA